MDYKTHPISREELRTIAKAIRKIFKCKNKYRFDVIDAFERAPILFPEITCAVVDNSDLDPGIPGHCVPDLQGHFSIEIAETVYCGAVRGVGGYRAHILHELCHAILCILGFTPVLDRAFNNWELKPYESMEWQAKALCGEVLMPYEETVGLSISKIMRYCQVSRESAELRANDYRKARS